MNRKNGPVTFAIHEIAGLPERLWEMAGRYKGDEWKVPDDKSLLKEIVSNEIVEELYVIENKARQNIVLRKILSEPLQSKNEELRLKAIRWVVYDWGHVRGERGSEAVWPQKLGDYSEVVIDKFIREHYKIRIASWSKVLGFADSKKYAIYDARVVASLNTILDSMGFNQRFYMPPPSSDKLPKVFSSMRKHVKANYPNKQPKYLGYIEYLNLLRTIVDKGLAKDILEVEMCLFAKGMKFAEMYAEKYGLID